MSRHQEGAAASQPPGAVVAAIQSATIVFPSKVSGGPQYVEPTAPRTWAIPLDTERDVSNRTRHDGQVLGFAIEAHKVEPQVEFPASIN